MAYVLDANVFIQAKNLHYGFDFCPAFWDWLLHAHASGKVFSIIGVKTELASGNDTLATWARDTIPESFFLPNERGLASYSEVATWAQAQSFDPAAISTFLQIADFSLTAVAKATGYTLVTHEVPAFSAKKIKIPNACVGLGIECIQPHEMLKRERARFVLGQ
jgi:Domain of unknown function (DUF4411)